MGELIGQIMGSEPDFRGNFELSMVSLEFKKIAYISRRLRKERELSFYGDIDFIPTEEYTDADTAKAIEDAKFVVHLAQKVMS
ncbi:MAG: hypothetical protein HZB37_07975 [Planctomycetes bacterium]|nr:hypothetical protein [Planctomycetota bacterium]